MFFNNKRRNSPYIFQIVASNESLLILLALPTLAQTVQVFSMSRICDEKCSKPKIFLVFLSKLVCFSSIL
jgi:hypothetical protein